MTDDEPVTRAAFFGSLAKAKNSSPPRFLPSWTAPLFGSVGQLMARSLRLSNERLKKATSWMPRYPSVHDGWTVTLEQMKDR